MFLVEFIGLPGAGKSTIHKKLVQYLQLEDNNLFLTSEEALMRTSVVKMDRVFRCILRILPYDFAIKFNNKLLNRSLMQFEAQNRFLAIWGKSFDAFLKSVEFNRMSIDERANVITYFIELGSVYECIRNQIPEKSIVFFEEGFVQKSFMFISTLQGEVVTQNDLFNYLDEIPVPDLIIYVKANFGSCFKRMLTRSEGLTIRLKNQKENDVINFLKASDNHLQKVVRWMEKNKSVTVLEIDNEKRLDDTMHELKRMVKKTLEINFSGR